jgi:hypothetical protein
LSAKDIYAERAQEQEEEGDTRRSGRRFAIILGASILLLFALTVGALYAIFTPRLRSRTQPAQSAAPVSNDTATANGGRR